MTKRCPHGHRFALYNQELQLSYILRVHFEGCAELLETIRGSFVPTTRYFDVGPWAPLAGRVIQAILETQG